MKNPGALDTPSTTSKNQLSIPDYEGNPGFVKTIFFPTKAQRGIGATEFRSVRKTCPRRREPY